MEADRRLRFDPVLCDLDGTLVDSAPAITTALRTAFSMSGVMLDPAQDLSSFVGPPLERTLAAAFPEPEAAARILEAYRREYARIIEVSTPLMPGAEAAIRAFSEAGATLGVVTYKPTPLAEKVLTGTGLRHLFHLVIGTTPPGPPPSKDTLLGEALAALGPHRGPPVYVGDHTEDRVAAAECGVPFIAYGPEVWTDIMRQVLAD